MGSFIEETNSRISEYRVCVCVSGCVYWGEKDFLMRTGQLSNEG